MSVITPKLERYRSLGPKIAWVLSTFNAIEWKLKLIIFRFIAPPSHTREFVEHHLLHNAVIDVGSKLRLVTYVAKREGWKFTARKVHDLIRLRNAFAHGFETYNIKVKFTLPENGENNIRIDEAKSRLVIKPLYPNGEVVTKDFEVAYQEFVKLYSEVNIELENISRQLPPDPAIGLESDP